MPDPLRAGVGHRVRAHSAGGLNVSHRPRARTPSPAHSQHGGGHGYHQGHVAQQQHQMTVPDWQFGNFLAPPGASQQHAQQQQNELLGMGMYLGGDSSGSSDPSTMAFDFNTWYPTSTAAFDFRLLPAQGDIFQDPSNVYALPEHQQHPHLHPQLQTYDQDHDTMMVVDQTMYQPVEIDPTQPLYMSCWRCMVYQVECDTSTPCRCCQNASTDTAWLDIGCRRGSLAAAVPTTPVCPNAGVDQANVLGLDTPQGAAVSKLLESSSSAVRNSWERLLGMLSDPRDPPHKIMLEMLCQPGDLAKLRLSMQTDPALGMAVDQNLVQLGDGVASTDTVGVVWELLDNPAAKQMLGIQSVEMFTEALKAAVTFEAEYGQSVLVSSSIAAMKCCLDALRIRSAGNGLLTADAHAACFNDHCKLPCFNRLKQCDTIFMEELNRLVCKEGGNLQGDRRWWLSWFYSLWIRAYVRRALLAIERHFQARKGGSRSAENTLQRPSFQYIHLAVRAFRAASAGYDPLILPWTVEELPGITESASRHHLRFLKYLRYAQRAFRTDTWQGLGIFSTFDYLERLFEVQGSAIADAREATRPLRGTTSPLLQPYPDQLAYGDMSVTEKRKSFDISSQASAKRRASSANRSESLPLATRSPQVQGAIRRGTDPQSNSIPPSPAYSQSSSSARYPHISSSESQMHSRSPSIDVAMGAAGSMLLTPRLQREGSADSLRGLGLSMTEQWHAHSPTQSEGEEGLRLQQGRLPAVPTLPSSSRARKHREDAQPTARRRGAGRGRSELVCGCCPKKPKTFLTTEELRAHEAEKNFECPTCHNRFKNKNEAERHRNTLHVRRYSWSCSLLAEAVAAFFPDNAAGCDVCGYCGVKFKWSKSRNAKAGKARQTEKKKRGRLSWGEEIVVDGRDDSTSAGEVGLHDNDGNDDNDKKDSEDDCTLDGEGEDDNAEEESDEVEEGAGQGADDAGEDGEAKDMAARIEHILSVHRFGKCNAAKKFYRADHFRQHLKHSHGSVPGKWTSVLEDACRVHEAAAVPATTGRSRANA